MTTKNYPIEKIKANVVCPVELELSLRILGGKWRGSILYQLIDGPLRFKQLQVRVQDGVINYKDEDHWLTSKVLSEHLHASVSYGLIEKVMDKENDNHHYYQLSVKGESVVPILLELFYWGDANY